MTEVLGMTVRDFRRNYERICLRQSETPLPWTGGQVSVIRRVPWNEFASYLTPVSDHLKKMNVSLKQFHRELAPDFFAAFLSAHLTSRILTPVRLMKIIDTFSGNKMFQCGVSHFEPYGTSSARQVIHLHPHLQRCRAFFEHCLAGYAAYFEFAGFDGVEIKNISLAEDHLDVTFSFVGTTSVGRLPDCQPADLLRMIDAMVVEIGSPGLDHTSWLDWFAELAQMGSAIGKREQIADDLSLVASYVQLGLEAAGSDRAEACFAKARSIANQMKQSIA